MFTTTCYNYLLWVSPAIPPVHGFPMDLKQLEYFVCVSEHGGFTRAAIELGITQPALSKQVRQLGKH